MHRLSEFLGDGPVGDDGLLRRADDGVIKSFGADDQAGGLLNIGAAIDIAGHVAGADPVGGFADGMGCLDHARSTSGQDQAGAFVLHQFLGAVQRDVAEALDQIWRRAGLLGRFSHYPGGFQTAFDGCWVRRMHDRVAGFDCDQGFKDDGGGRIGAGAQSGHNANRPGDLDQALGVITLDNANGGNITDGVPHIAGAEFVFDAFVGGNAVAGFVVSHLAKAA